MSSPITWHTRLLLLTFIVLVAIPGARAFGAGDIPDFAFLEGKAFRHGDIESVLEELYKNVGSGFPHFEKNAGKFLLGLAAAAVTGGKGQKFSGRDVRRVYFGNWLRDYSQAADIAGLSKLTMQSIVTVISVLGFLSFGYATEEFQVTEERLGVYLPVEHIDNPKGYAQVEGDARRYHPKLRPPVEDRELEIDTNNGMKKYIASDNQGFDTSTAHIRRTLHNCIDRGRSSGGHNGPELFEAYRLLGTALHTLEDFTAHSNWCEIMLNRMGHGEVFSHVGDNVRINTPNGQAAPLVTGTFGGADFLHSLLGEGQDKFSQSSVSDLAARMEQAKQDEGGKLSTLQALISQIPASGSGASPQEQMQKGEEIKQSQLNLDPDKIAPEDLQKRLWDILVWRDNLMRDISNVVEHIPGLSGLLDKISLALMEYVFTTVEPWLTPLLKRVTGALKEGSEAIISLDDQFRVFNDPNASDPSHSLLSKDHFGLLLNEPAGEVARVVVQHSVNIVVKCWFDQNQDKDQAINRILEAIHHPYYTSGNSEVQNAMKDAMMRWFGGLGGQQGQAIEQLTKDAVRNHRNVRLATTTNTELGRGY